jgi:hypothetical protein
MRAFETHRELTANHKFWENEEEIRQESLKFIKELQRIRWYDPYLIKPEPYDMKAADNAQPKKK